MNGRALLEKAEKDIQRLKTKDGILHAGIPKFRCFFGRDSIITAMELLNYDFRIARKVLLKLANLQGKGRNTVREEEPGKIMHELRINPPKKMRGWDFPYYGSIDATPLFVILAEKYLERTKDVRTIKAIYPNLEKAIYWCIYYGDKDTDGIIEYQRLNSFGLENQGWRDSHDGILTHLGEKPPYPIAPVEVQGYLLAALKGFFELWRMGSKDNDDGAKTMADVYRHIKLTQREIERFYWPHEKYYHLALDGWKEPVYVVSSNPGHLLFCEVVSQERAEMIAKRLFEPDLYSGWGIRTVSAKEPFYNPEGYHTGSVWVWDNWMIIQGLRRYGLDEYADKLSASLLEAIEEMGCIPELFPGYARGERKLDHKKTKACSIQAWSCGAVINLLKGGG